MSDIRSAPCRKPFLIKHRDYGLLLAGGEFNPDNLRWALEDFVPHEEDIFICTYPKCGTTWTMNILHTLRNGGEGLEPGQNINVFIPQLESDGKTAVERLTEPRILKTHLPYDMVPKNSKSKYICIVRNPKDCCVSFYHHTKGFPRYYDFAEGIFEDYFECFLSGKIDYNDYFDHLLSWTAHRGDPNVLLLLYENMKADIRTSIEKIANFLGGTFLHNSKDSLVLDAVIKKSDFETMKANSSMWSSERSSKIESFIRKGQVGDWRTHFTRDQSDRMDLKFQQKLKGTEEEHLWDDFDCLKF